MASIGKRIKSAYENMNKLKNENDLFEAKRLLNNVIEEVRQLENAIFESGDYPYCCFSQPTAFMFECQYNPFSNGSHEEFKKVCKNFCIENAKKLVKHFYKKYHVFKGHIESLAQSELESKIYLKTGEN